MKTIAIIGAALGLTSVLMGAAGDHLFPGENIQRLDVALRYHQLYAVLIFCLGLYGMNIQPHPKLERAGHLFCAGTILFCGSLYTSLLPGFESVTYLTPIGGITLMAGWIFSLLSIRGK